MSTVPAGQPIACQFCLGCGAPVKHGPGSGSPASYADLQNALSEALEQLQTNNRELVEAQEQQTATADILRAISSSPADIQPVLDTLVKSAVRFVGAHDATIHRLDGQYLPVVAHYRSEE